MKSITVFLTITILFLTPNLIDAFAQEKYDVNIPTGAASPDAPYFWQSEKDGSTNGIIEIKSGDTIVWKNADTSVHTVTSGTPETGPDDIFDSGLFGPGKKFSQTFSDVGDYPYFCLTHPWMQGSVIITSGYSTIPQVGKQIGDGTTFFDVKYDFNRLLSEIIIDEGQKSITFEIIGNAKSDDNVLELRMPSGLIDGPFVIWVDGENVVDFEQDRDGDVNIISVELDEDSKILTIVGTSVVPEFGQVAMLIFGLSVAVMIVLNQKVSLRSNLNF